MKKTRQATIDALTGELEPARPLRRRMGLLLLAAAGVATLAAVAGSEGIRWSVFRGEASPFFWATSGLLAVLGAAAASAVIDMARPGVGNRYGAPRWAAAMVGVLPAVALVSLLSHEHGMATLMTADALHCVTSGLQASLITAGALILWQRRGAPVSLGTAGWYTGTAAGALGMVAYGFSCGVESLVHLGIWHVVPVAIAAVVGRILVPVLVRW